MNNELPFEVLEFEQLLNKPNSDPTGFAGFFNAGEVWVARVPARLDVMGGIADYSGANVCEAVLGGGVLMALQARTDRTLRFRTMQAGFALSGTGANDGGFQRSQCFSGKPDFSRRIERLWHDCRTAPRRKSPFD